MADIQPFEFRIYADTAGWQCQVCDVYVGEVEVCPIGYMVCRICLSRLRKTLKEAEKALPALPKVPRPQEAP